MRFRRIGPELRRRILLVITIVVVLAQLFQPDRSAHSNAPEHDLIAITRPDTAVQAALRVACYDCHSDHTTYPWYSYITPVNFWLEQHVDEGREELNMSAWGDRREKWQRHKAKESVEMLEEGEMPPSSYTLVHRNAELSADQRAALIAFFQELR